jgi:hypothetical protein
MIVTVFVASWLGVLAAGAPAAFVSSWPRVFVSSLAHHSVLPYDGGTPTSVEGTVTAVLWQNPHALIRLEVRAASGELERWTVESEGSTELTRLGWTRDAVTVGSRVLVIGARARDGRHMLRCRTMTLPDDRVLACFRHASPTAIRDSRGAS